MFMSGPGTIYFLLFIFFYISVAWSRIAYCIDFCHCFVCVGLRACVLLICLFSCLRVCGLCILVVSCMLISKARRRKKEKTKIPKSYEHAVNVAMSRQHSMRKMQSKQSKTKQNKKSFHRIKYHK